MRSPIRTWRNTINRRRHFERLPERPEGFVAIADAARLSDVRRFTAT